MASVDKVESALAAAVLVVWALSLAGTRWAAPRALTARPAWVGLGLGLHAASLGAAWWSAGHLPLDSMRFGLSALALWVALGWGWLRAQPRMESLGVLLIGLVVLLFGAAQLAPNAGGGTAREGLWFPAHVTLILVGLGGLAVSASLSSVFLFVQRQLKAKRFQGLARLPSLDVLDRRNYQAMSFGFVCLTAGMAIGGVWAATHPEASMGPTFTVWGTVLLWMWYAAALHARLVSGWQGRLAAVFGVGGFVGMGAMVAIAAVVLRGWH
jgi:ABC-type transport system involved in cytochrome c biogenesis permease subunit